MAKRLGIVYTPIEVIDFIIHSVNHLLQTEFGQSSAVKACTFLTPLLAPEPLSRVFSKADLLHPMNYPTSSKAIHANEIVLLAYYIATNQHRSGLPLPSRRWVCPLWRNLSHRHLPALWKEDLISDMLEDNSARRKRQSLDIRVIMGIHRILLVTKMMSVQKA